jgi:chorismate synthase
MGSTYGKIFKIATFGESHGVGIGVVIEGCPAGVTFDSDFIQSELTRRKKRTISKYYPAYSK